MLSLTQRMLFEPLHEAGAVVLEPAGDSTLYQAYYPNTSAAEPVLLMCPPNEWVVGAVGYSNAYLERM